MKHFSSSRLIVCLFFFCILPLPTFAESKQDVDHVQDWVYSVVKGDNLSSILSKCCKPEVDFQQLANYNDISHVNLIHPGQQLRIPYDLLKTQLLSIQTIAISGKVTVKKSQEAGFSVLHVADEISQGDVIKTGENSIAKLRFADHSELTIQPNSTLTVESSHQVYQTEKRKIKVKLSQGRVEIQANPHHEQDRLFEVETPSAVAVVRGTQFRMGADEGLSTEETLDGAVAFSVAEQSVLVAKDYGSAAKQGQPPLSPQPLPLSPSLDGFEVLYEYLPIDFKIESKSDVVAFVSQLAKDAEFIEIVSEANVPNTPDGKQLSFNELLDGQYYLKLRAKDANGLESRDAIHAFNVQAWPYPPTLMHPLADEEIPSLGQLFTWTKVDDATGYLIQIASDEAFEHVLLERQVPLIQFEWSQPLPKGSTFWRVAAERGRKLQKYSKPRKLAL